MNRQPCVHFLMIKERVGFVSDPAAIRTRDRLLRRQMLYPAELPDRM